MGTTNTNTIMHNSQLASTFRLSTFIGDDEFLFYFNAYDEVEPTATDDGADAELEINEAYLVIGLERYPCPLSTKRQEQLIWENIDEWQTV